MSIKWMWKIDACFQVHIYKYNIKSSALQQLLSQTALPSKHCLPCCSNDLSLTSHKQSSSLPKTTLCWWDLALSLWHVCIYFTISWCWADLLIIRLLFINQSSNNGTEELEYSTDSASFVPIDFPITFYYYYLLCMPQEDWTALCNGGTYLNFFSF